MSATNWKRGWGSHEAIHAQYPSKAHCSSRGCWDGVDGGALGGLLFAGQHGPGKLVFGELVCPVPRPFAEIADLFESETGCEMSVTYANAAQIQTQINTTGAGDFFIAGSKEELKPVETAIASSEDLVKHIPVLAVPASNPQNITGLASLANAKRVLVGDPESTPIGKIAMNALTNAGLWESLMASGVITTTTTAPQIATALGNGEGDVGIVWKENVSDDNVVIVDTKDLDSMVKVIPAAQLESAQDIDAANAFKEFLQADAVWDIWASYGYERA